MFATSLPSIHRSTTRLVPKFALLCTIRRPPLLLFRENIEASELVQSGELDRELVLVPWPAILVTEIAQAKTTAGKSLVAALGVERITQVSSRTNFSPTTSDFLRETNCRDCAANQYLASDNYFFFH